MTNPRVRKIADRIQVIVAEMLERRIKDPRLGFVTITDVRVTGDTPAGHRSSTPSSARDEELASTGAALESAKGVIRSEVAKQLGMRIVPTLTFIPDALPENARALDEVLARAKQQRRGGRRAARRGVRRRGRPVQEAAREPDEDDDDDDRDERRRPSTARTTAPDGRPRPGRRRQGRRA